MRMKALILAGSASLLLIGCSSPRGGTDETNLESQNQSVVNADPSMTNTDEGVTPMPMNEPSSPALSGRNPRDLRDPQALTIPGPPMGPRP